MKNNCNDQSCLPNLLCLPLKGSTNFSISLKCTASTFNFLLEIKYIKFHSNDLVIFSTFVMRLSTSMSYSTTYVFSCWKYSRSYKDRNKVDFKMLTYIAIWLGVAGNEGEIWNDTNRLTFAVTEQGASLQIYRLNTGESLGPNTGPSSILLKPSTGQGSNYNPRWRQLAHCRVTTSNITIVIIKFY